MNQGSGSVFYQDITNFNQCPVPDSERKRTDIFCTICSSLFALILFIVACATFNNSNLVRMTYYLDGDGNLCGYDDAVKDYDWVYFTSMNDASKRLCVSKCPQAGDTKLNCYPTSKLACGANSNSQFEVQIYETSQQINRIGGICLPTDPTLYDKVFQMSQMYSKYTFLTIYDSIWTSLWVSIVLGVVLIILYQVMPRKIVHWLLIIGALIFFAVGIAILIVSNGFIPFKILGAAVFIFIGAIIATTFIKQQYRRQAFICGRLYQIAAQIVKQRPIILLTILIWSALFVGLLALTSFEILSGWSIGPLYSEPQTPFLKTNSFISNLMSFFVFIQFIWALSFLKESFNFCVSGYATNWYCFRQTNQGQVKILSSVKRLIKFHWGSVVGGSLLLWTFYIFDLFVDFFSGTDTKINASESKLMSPKPFNRQVVERRGCRGFFDLIRSQAFGYINLIPIPYCNASRYCEMMADDSSFYDRSQTTNRLYRTAAHATIMMISTLIALNANKHTDSHPDVVGVFFVAIVSFFTCTYFIAFHGDLAQGILISVFVQERLNLYGQPININGQLEKINHIDRPPQIVKDLYYDDLKEVYENSTIVQYLKGHVEINGQDGEHAKADIF